MKVRYVGELGGWCDVSANTARPLTAPEINQTFAFFEKYKIDVNERHIRNWDIQMPSWEIQTPSLVPPLEPKDTPMKAMGTHEMFDCKSTITVELELYEIMALIEWHNKRKLEAADEENYKDALDHKQRAAWLETYRKANK